MHSWDGPVEQYAVCFQGEFKLQDFSLCLDSDLLWQTPGKAAVNFTCMLFVA